MAAIKTPHIALFATAYVLLVSTFIAIDGQSSEARLRASVTEDALGQKVIRLPQIDIVANAPDTIEERESVTFVCEASDATVEDGSQHR